MPPLAPIAPALLAWYYQNRRILPFREDPTPYHIWVSEIMLQQTRVAAALGYYQRFMQELPSIEALATCSEQKLQKLWQGFGYYSRVRNLQKAAQIVVQQYGGQLPANYNALLALPGIGEYTAGAIASIAFGLPHVAVDGNVLRVFSRLLASKRDILQPAAKKWFTLQVQAQQPPQQAGDFNQALMELGALVCLPKNPQCGQCPLHNVCRGHQQGIAAALPCKTPKKPKVQQGISLFLVHRQGHTLLQQRPPKGLLAGLWQPLLAEQPLAPAEAEAFIRAIFAQAGPLQPLPPATHIFTHRVWNMQAWQCSVPANTAAPAGCVFASPGQIKTQYSIPGAFKAYLPYME